MTYIDEYRDPYLATYGVFPGATLPQIQVKIDWTNNPIGAGASAGSAFTDVSSYVYLSQGITIARGRQDNISVVQPSRCTFTLFNDDGRFTPGLSSSPYYPGVILGRRVQVNVKDETGTYHTRFDGMIAEINIVDTVTGKDTGIQLACTDVLSFLNRFPAYSCWTVQECQYQATPALQYLMNEPANSQGIYDSSGNNGPALPLHTYSNPPYQTLLTGGTDFYLSNPVANYQSGNSPVEGFVAPFRVTGIVPATEAISSPLQSIQFTATANNATVGNTVATAGPSAQFEGLLPQQLIIGTNNFTILGWVYPDPSVVQNSLFDYNLELICLSNTRSGAMLSIEDHTAGVTGVGTDIANTFRAAYYSNYVTGSPSGTSTTGFNSSVVAAGSLADQGFMLAIVVTGTTAKFYLGGNLISVGLDFLTDATTLTLPAGATFNYLSIGGPLGGGNGWVGNISNVCLYNQALTVAQLQDLAFFGAAGPQANWSGTGFQRAAVNYTNLPSYWTGTIDQGLSRLDYVDITGSNPPTVAQNITAVEHGLYFIDASGRVNFHDRSRRMGAAVPAVTLPAGSYNVGIKPKINDQYLINYEALQNERGGSGVISQNTTSIAQYGVYPNGSLQSPQTAPYATYQTSFYNRTLNGAGGGADDAFSNQNISDAGSWDVNTLGQPAMKLAALTINMLANQSGQNEYVAPSVLYGLEINQALGVGHNLPWWPNSPMSSELFIEGINETYSTGEATIAFYTSPAFQGRAWIPGSSAYGQLDVSARVGISITQGTTYGTLPLILPGPAYSSGMNLGAGTNGYIGATDQLTVSTNLQNLVTPPLCMVEQVSVAQTFSSGIAGFIVWDTTAVDTVSGFGLSGDVGTTYSVIVPGWYEVCLTLNMASTSGTLTAYILQVAQTPGNVTTFENNRQLAPVTAEGPSSGNAGVSTSAVFWCNAGDGIGGAALIASGGTTALTNGGSHMSIRYLGQGTNRN